MWTAGTVSMVAGAATGTVDCCAKVCVGVASGIRAAARSTVTTWASVTNQVLALREHLIVEQVTLVVMGPPGT